MNLQSSAGYSEYYFSRKFKQEMGCTLTEYIMREKIDSAKVLLSSTSMSIMEISIELSFNSRSYFSDTFQKNTGISPGEYRKQNVGCSKTATAYYYFFYAILETIICFPAASVLR